MKSLLVPIMILPALVSPAAGAGTPAEELLGVMMSEVTQPQNRCRWMAGELRHLESTLSLFRADRPRLLAEIDGRPLADTTRQIHSTVFETRLLGPATVTLTLDQLPNRRLSVRPGQQLGISLRDGRGRMHPLFCGIVFDRRSSGRDQIQVSALLPRAGDEARRSRRFADMRRSEVISTLAQEAGLEVQIDRTDSEPQLSVLSQRNTADWLFMSRLASDDGMQLTLTPAAVLHYQHSTFSPPEPPPQRKFTNMTWVEAVRELALQEGLQVDIELQATLTNSTFLQNQPNLRFAHDLAARHEHSAFVSGRTLKVLADGIWQRNPALADNRRMNIGVDDLARTIARRHRLPLRVRVPQQRPSTLTRREQTDSEFLFASLAAHGMHLRRSGRGLALEAARVPGDVADLLVSRVMILSGGAAGSLTRGYGVVRDQLLDPLGVPARTLTLELGGRPTRRDLGPGGRDPIAARRDLRAMRIASPQTSNALDLAAGDLSVAARSLDEAIKAMGVPADAREAFLTQLARVYRPTLLFLQRVQAPVGQSPRRD